MDLAKISKLLLSLMILVALGTFGYMYIEGQSFFDSLYMTVITLSTVGYSEKWPLSQSARLFTIILIFCGVGNMAYILTTIFRVILDVRFNEIYGRRKMSKALKGLKNHTILCGFGKMGRPIAKELHLKKQKFVIVDNNEEKIKELEELGYLYILGNASDDEILTGAGINNAKSLVTVVTTDAENVFITLSARTLNKDIMIVSRIFDDNIYHKLVKAGANKIVSPYAQAGLKIGQSIINPAVDDFMEIISDDQTIEFQMADVVIDEHMLCIGKTLKEFNLKEQGMLIVGIKRSDKSIVFAPHKDEMIELGDRLIAIGKGENFAEIIAELTKVH